MIERTARPLRRLGDWLARVVDAFYRALGRPGKLLQDFLNGSWLGHPTHPVVTDVIVGGATVVVVLDLAAMAFGLTDLESATQIALLVTWLAGVSSIVTGLTDFKDTALGDERNVALLHGLINIIGTAAFIISSVLRLVGDVGAGRWASFSGAAVIAVGAFIGGHLVFKYGYMVNFNAFPRARRAPDFTSVMPAADLPDGQPTRATLGTTVLVVVRRGDLVTALKESCSHAGGPLAKGALEGDTITCPWHGSRFRLTDGAVRHGPATTRQVAYRARIHEGQVEVAGPIQ